MCKRYLDSLYSEDGTGDMGYETGVDSQSEDEDGEDGEVHVYDMSKELMKIFACKHTFHVRCLHKYYKQKPSEPYEQFIKRTEKLRCPTCNLKNFDIDNEGGNKHSAGGGMKFSKSKAELLIQ